MAGSLHDWLKRRERALPVGGMVKVCKNKVGKNKVGKNKVGKNKEGRTRCARTRWTGTRCARTRWAMTRWARTRWARTMSRSRSWWTMSQILSQIDTDRVGGYESAIFQRIGGLINYVTPQ